MTRNQRSRVLRQAEKLSKLAAQRFRGGDNVRERGNDFRPLTRLQTGMVRKCREDSDQHVCDAIDEFLHSPSGASAGVQCEAEQKGKQQDRQNLAFREGADERLRNQMQCELDEPVRLRARRILRQDGRVQMMRVDVQSRTRMQRERGREAQNARTGRRSCRAPFQAEPGRKAADNFPDAVS
ncbi:hypothetical protein OKW43_006906 [Paraburkholderia sp. WC7.3g]